MGGQTTDKGMNILSCENINMQKMKNLCTAGALRWTNHVLTRLFQRGISTSDIENAIMHGEIIESYPNDYPYPSYLVLGIAIDSKYIHVVCGIGDTELWLITAYYPDINKWDASLKIRKENDK